jgi:hypothetical protein
MKEELISFDTAKLAKEKSFDVECNYAQFPLNRKPVYNESKHDWNLYDDGISIPTQSLLQRWLREEHKFHIQIITEACKESSGRPYWQYILYKLASEEDIQKYANGEFGQDGDLMIEPEMLNEDWFYNEYDTYEEALEQGLHQALLLIATA